MTKTSSVNPFIVQSPEGIDAAEALRLFVDVFTDFHKIREPGHAMLHGPRGCGKSMMFRYLLPDCQCLSRNCSLRELPFFAVLISIKNTDPNLTELQRLVHKNSNVILNEHLLTMFVLSKVFSTLSRITIPDSTANLTQTRETAKTFQDRLRLSGWRSDDYDSMKAKSPLDIFCYLKDLCDRLYIDVVNYLRRLSFLRKAPGEYTGPLCGYLDLIIPTVEALSRLPYMPKGPFYILVDDADYLNLVQTRILNSWISTRTSANVSIKVSTQLRYKSYQTLSGMTVDTPHDYSEVNISDIYTTSRGKYLSRVKEIVAKRLVNAGIANCTPETFFPSDATQDKRIAEVAARIRRSFTKSGRGYRASDDVVRYARPIYMAELQGARKAGRTYSYAGFEQLVHISSGLIRYFLEPAARMFAEEQALSSQGIVKKIRSRIQNKIIRDEADRLMFTEFDRIFREEHEHSPDDRHRAELRDNKRRLHNLIRALGGVFHEKLLSQDSERRVFSVAFMDQPDEDVLAAFKLGIQFGYFHRSTIGNKERTGRTPLYVLTRRLAPHFGLDPHGFAGYLFVMNERMREAIDDPDKFLRRVKARGVTALFEERQLKLFQ